MPEAWVETALSKSKRGDNKDHIFNIHWEMTSGIWFGYTDHIKNNLPQ